MNRKKTYTGRCFCGAVEIAVTGEPMTTGCRRCGSTARYRRRVKARCDDAYLFL